MKEHELIQQAIFTLEQQREHLGNAVADAAILALREKLTRLRQPPPVAEQRKQITVLFADITDFTQLSEHMDAEEITELLSLLWGRIDRLILQRGGRIDKHMGDSVMAFWGADQAREDDAEQALRAALDIKRLIQELRPQIRLPRPLDFCIGISTGPVVLNTLHTTGEYTAIGPTVNLAYRLEGVAPAGGILICHDTYQHVRGLFQGYALPPLTLKGFSEPIQAYQIVAALPLASRHHLRNIEGSTRTLIGRQAELEQLQATYHEVETQRRPQIVHITGEAGIGKSRLVQEFESWMTQQETPPLYFKSHARQATQTMPYALLRDMFSLYCGIYENDQPEVVALKLAQALDSQADGAATPLPPSQIVGTLLGFQLPPHPYFKSLEHDPEQLHHQAARALQHFFQNLGTRQLLVLELEDLQWADSSSRHLLGWLLENLPHIPMLVLCVTRTEGEQPLAFTELFTIPQQHIPLNPLSRRESRQLIAEILPKLVILPPAVEELLISKAQGNPFYTEELIQTLIEERIILKNTPQWQVDPARLEALSVPSTLTGILQARLDALPPAAREVLQCAAVIGPVFWDAAIAALHTPDGMVAFDIKKTYETQLELLRRRGIIVRKPASIFAGTQEFAFKNALMRDVVYECTLQRDRQQYHARAARWLSTYNSERAGEFSGQIAEHLLRAGAILEAIHMLQQAGQQAAARFANEQAIAYFKRALTLTTEKDLTQRCSLYLDLEAVYEIAGNREGQEEVLTALQRLVELMGNPECQLTLALRKAAFLEAISDYPAAVTAAQEAIRLAQELQRPTFEAESYLRWGRVLHLQGAYEEALQKLNQGRLLLQPLVHHTLDSEQRSKQREEIDTSRNVLAEILRNLGIAHWRLGQREEARACYEMALSHYRALRNIRGAARCLGNLGILASEHAPKEAVVMYQQALALYREIGSRVDEADTLNNLGIVLHFSGELEAAHASYQQVLELRRATKDRQRETIALSNLGSLALQQGHFEEARTYYEQSLRINQEIGNRQGLAGNLGDLGIVALERGDHDTALQLLQAALTQVQQLGQRHAESDMLYTLCQLHRERHALAEARTCGEQALRIARALQYRFTEADVLIELGYIRQAQGQLHAARTAFKKVLEIYQDMEQPQLMLKGRLALAQLWLEPSWRTPEGLQRAQQEVSAALGALENLHSLTISERMKAYLACYRVLEATQDARVTLVLEQAYQLLMTCAAHLPHETARRMFFENISANRQLLAAWRAYTGGPTDSEF